MNGIEKIITRIEVDSAAAAGQIKSDADARCAAIRAEYDKKAAEAYEAIITRGRADADTRYDRLCGAARLQARKDILQKKQELIGSAFDKAVETLAALPESEYIGLCARLAADASVTGEEKIVLSARDKASFGEKIRAGANEILAGKDKKAALTVADESRDIRGGVILVNGKIEMNCSLELLVGGLKNELSPRVAGVLLNDRED